MRPRVTARWIGFPATVLALCLAALLPGAARAQGVSPAVMVNDRAITGYEVEQRAALLRALGAPGDLVEEATNRLIDERLQVQAATAAGFSATPKEIDEGVAEFAGRANTTPENFLATIAQRGVAPETFRAFVEAGVIWRKFVREKLGPRVNVGAADIAAAKDRAGSEGGVRVLLSEIILPARNAAEAAQSEARVAELSGINGFEAFAAAARAYSAAASRQQGGRIDWVPLDKLPPPVRQQILSLKPGQVTAPLRAPNAIAIFQLRAIDEVAAPAPAVESIDYAQYLAADAAEARRVADQVDSCDDLYGVAKSLPADRLIRQTLPPAQIPGDVRAELDRLDRDEVSLRLSRGGLPAVTMLCERKTVAAAALDEGDLRARLVNQRLAGLAENYLAGLRADAVIVEAK